jgi:imidazolonepropionase-like amidohydrolase
MRTQSSVRLAAVGALLCTPLALAASGSRRAPEGRGYIAVKAGTIHLVEGGEVLQDGVILIRGDVIESIGSGVAVPADARLVDYGPDAVIIPGLVAADSNLALGIPSERTAEPGLRAIDNFDFYNEYAATLAAGVTAAYLKPTEARLIGGEGAVVKLAGTDHERRLLKAPAAINGAIHAAARNTPGFWEPPVPATSDVGLGYAVDQLPKSTMGAIVALGELLSAARGEKPTEEYGPRAVAALAELLGQSLPWRITAEREEELRALLDFARERGIPLVIDGGTEAGYLADEIAAAGVPVIYNLPWLPNGRGRDAGKGEDDRWPTYDGAAKLAAAGARVAIAAESTSDLFFAASVAMGEGLDAAGALRAITLTPAEIYGVADRVGSLRPGKDADFVVLSGAPIALGTSVQSTWVGGVEAWSFATSGARAKAERDGVEPPSETLAIQVNELYLGDGRVLSPGQVVLRNGKIVSVSEGHSTPPGARSVHGAAAMPGIIDALGHLGLEGSTRTPGLDTDLEAIVAPGDAVDRRVAKAGVTTVAMSPRGTGSAGVPVLAYKPAAAKLEGQVLGDPTAVRLQWTDLQNRLNSGKEVRELLGKAKEYRDKWLEYEKAIAEWKPPPPAPEKPKEGEEAEKKDGEGEKAGSDEEKKDASGDKSGGEKKAAEGDEKDKDKKKKKDAEPEDEPDPITGVWTASIENPPAEPAPLRMQLKLGETPEKGSVEGNLRCAAVTEGLIDVRGFYDAASKSLALKGLGSRGWVTLEGTYAEAKLKGTLASGVTTFEVEIERTAREYVIAKRSEVRKPKEEEQEEPKGKPKAPRLDPRLEPLRAALNGQLALILQVDRGDEILACVDTCAGFGVKPVLYQAAGIEAVLDRVVGRIRGVLLSHAIKVGGTGTDTYSPYAALQEAGIPVAFHSLAEEGAVDLPLMAMYAIANGMSPAGALRALTADAAEMLSIGARVGSLEAGRDGDVLLLSGPPLAPGTRVMRVWVNGVEVK